MRFRENGGVARHVTTRLQNQMKKNKSQENMLQKTFKESWEWTTQSKTEENI